jgi:dTDP-4-dehydrorhamnose reductase
MISSSPVLITGGSGLLAINWACSIRQARRVVLGLHDRYVTLPGVSSQRVDLESVDRFEAALAAVEPSLVVHTAALTSIERCEAEPALARHVNVDLAENVAKACKRRRVPLVHISTDHLFDGTDSYTDEDDPVTPQNVYGRTKAEAERRVVDACPEALVVRTNIYGWGPGYRPSFSDRIVLSLRDRRPVALFEDAFYTPILIDPLAIAVHDLVERRAAGVFHVVCDERLSKYQFGLLLAEQFALDARLIERSRLAERRDLVRRPLDLSLSNRKARALLGRSLGGARDHVAALFSQERAGRRAEVPAA